MSAGDTALSGDGTVPLISMHFPLLATTTNTFVADSYHGELPNVVSVELVDFITQ